MQAIGSSSAHVCSSMPIQVKAFRLVVVHSKDIGGDAGGGVVCGRVEASEWWLGVLHKIVVLKAHDC
jgi:hypothetical protein